MKIGSGIVEFSVNRPKTVLWAMLLSAVVVLLLAGLPSLWPKTFYFLNPVKVDTDPENMLPSSEPVRVFHNAIKKEMGLHDIIVVGIVNETDPEGVFNPSSLNKIYLLTEYVKKLNWPAPDNTGKRIGVIDVDIIAPSLVDNIEQGGTWRG